MTMAAVLVLRDGIRGIAKAQFDIRTTYALSGIGAKVEAEARRFDELNKQLVMTLGKDDGKGSVRLSPEDSAAWGEYTARSNELLLLESDLAIEPMITMEQLEAAFTPDEGGDGKKKSTRSARLPLGVVTGIRPLIKEIATEPDPER
jgi:hypothetical protein